jgi:hypothetical protein
MVVGGGKGGAEGVSGIVLGDVWNLGSGISLWTIHPGVSDRVGSRIAALWSDLHFEQIHWSWCRWFLCRDACLSQIERLQP